MLIGLKIAFGLVAVWVSLQDEVSEALVRSDFAFYSILAWLFILTGYLGGFSFRASAHSRFAKIYLVSYGVTAIAVLLYCVRPLGYLHAPLQLDSYNLFIALSPERAANLAVAMLLLGIVTLPPLIHRHTAELSEKPLSEKPYL
jgi:hypothetical protein